MQKKEMDGITQEVVYIGARFDDLFWKTKEKLRNHHFYLEIIKDTQNRGQYHINICRYGYFKLTNIENFIEKHLKKQNELDSIISIYEYDELKNRFAIGEKSTKMFSILETIQQAPVVLKMLDDGTAVLKNTSSIIQIFQHPEEEKTEIYAGKFLIKTITSLEKANEWIRELESEQKQIIDCEKQILTILQDKLKLKEIRFISSNRVMMDQNDSIEVKLYKMYRSGKSKMVIEIDAHRPHTREFIRELGWYF